MTETSLSLDEARHIAVRAQQMGSVAGLDGKEATADAVDRLGYVQIDTISVVARAHHHTLWARVPAYHPSFLDDLLRVDRRVFEYWAHAIAYLPMSDFRFYIPRMKRHRTSHQGWLSDWKKEHGPLLNHVLERIRAEGPLTSKDFTPPPGTRRGTWWDWKPSKRALEILFWQGHLMITERRNFQKVYDLTERVLPSETDTSEPSQAELGRFHVRRALHGMGIAREREIRDAFHVADRTTISQTLQAMCASREILEIHVSGSEEAYFALPDALEADNAPADERAHILSPFDNLIIQRDRMRRLFGFDYTIECYVPKEKRRYGYFVLPILWEDRLIGRMDAKADRSSQTLAVKSLWFEPEFHAYDRALPALANAAARFSRFNGCTSIAVDRISPTGHKRTLKSLLKKALEQPE